MMTEEDLLAAVDADAEETTEPETHDHDEDPSGDPEASGVPADETVDVDDDPTAGEAVEPEIVDDDEVAQSAEIERAAALPVAEAPGPAYGDEFDGLVAQAAALSRSGLVQDGLKGKPTDVLLVLLTARDLGVATTAALRQCYVVNGKVTLAPALKLALIASKGLGRIVPDESNDVTRAIAHVFGPDGHKIATRRLTYADVADVTDEQGRHLVSKSSWRNYPARMLWWRLAGWCADDYFPEVAFGLYSADEVGGYLTADGQPIDVESSEAVPDGLRTDADRAAEERSRPIDDETARGLRSRIDSLPAAARAALADQWRAADLPPFGDLTYASVRRVNAILRPVETAVERGQYPADEEDDAHSAEAATVICGACGEEEADDGSCGCAPPDAQTDEAAAEPVEASVDDDAGRPFE